MAKKHDDDGRLKRTEYEKEIKRLQGELCKLQDWVKHRGLALSSSLKEGMLLERWHHSRDHRAGESADFPLVALACAIRPRKKLRCTSSVIWRTSQGPGRSLFR